MKAMVEEAEVFVVFFFFFNQGEIVEGSPSIRVEEMNCALSQRRCMVSVLSSWLQYFMFSFKAWGLGSAFLLLKLYV